MGGLATGQHGLRAKLVGLTHKHLFVHFFFIDNQCIEYDYKKAYHDKHNLNV